MNILPRNHDEYLQNLKKLQIQRNKKAVFNPEKSHKQNPPPYQHKVCEPILNISHIVSTHLHCGLQRNDHSVESLAKGTVRSVSESDGVSDGVGFR